MNLKYFVIKNEILPSLSLSPFTGHGHLVEWKEELSSIVYYGYRSFIKTFRFRPELNQKLSSRFLKFRSNSSTFGSHKVLMLRFSNLSGYFIANEKRAKFFRKIFSSNSYRQRNYVFYFKFLYNFSNFCDNAQTSGPRTIRKLNPICKSYHIKVIR